MSLAAELQGVFESACAADAALQAGDAPAAVDSYFLARSRLHFVLEGLLGGAGVNCAGPALGGCDAGGGGEADPDGGAARAVVAMACRQVDSTLTWALERLSTPPAEGDSGADGCSASLLMQDMEGTQQQDSLMQALPPQSSNRPRDVGAGLLEAAGHRGRAGGEDGAEGCTPELQDVARRCMREVEGSLQDVVGLDAIKQELREAVLLPMYAPHLFTGIRRPQSNVLFHGRPGTGKTLLVEKAAAEAGMPLLAVAPSTILSKWSGESEKLVQAVFEAAAALSPAIIFIDEIDALAPVRSSGDDLGARRVLTQLLLAMTQLASRPGCLVFVMACTNRLEDCDPALLRRFERKILVPVPDAEARAAFFRSTVQRPEIASSLSCEEVAALVAATVDMSGSDLAVVCRDAAMAPLRELLAAVQAGALGVEALAQAQPRQVAFADFAAAVERTKFVSDGSG